jgi:demethylmenaquinone methyltransferase/2-methoxy-6-polyprenyl-1,4-benzoquinol methylase
MGDAPDLTATTATAIDRAGSRHGSRLVIDADHLPEGEEKVRAVRSMFDAIAPRYDLVNRVMTFRMDVGWRRRTVRDLRLGPGSVVADLACGTGDFCRELSGAGLAPIGFDLSFGMLANARTDAPLAQADALRLPLPDGAIDGVTCGFALRNLVELGPFFGELARVVRPGGRIALLEVAEPANPVLRWGHGVYFGSVVPRIGGLLSDPAAYRYLPKSVAYLPEPHLMLDQLRDAGFCGAQRQLLSTGIAQLITATRERPEWATPGP